MKKLWIKTISLTLCLLMPFGAVGPLGPIQAEPDVQFQQAESAAPLHEGGLMSSLPGMSEIPAAASSKDEIPAIASRENEKSLAPPLPEPEGPEIGFFSDNFDSEAYGATGGIVVPLPWIQTGEGGSKAKTSVSSSAPSAPNLMKIDVTDSVYLPVNTTGYGNIKVSYYIRASSYVSGSIVVDWSPDGGATWNVLEEFKLPPGTAEAPRSEPNTLKTWTLPSDANSNPNVRIRFRVGDPMNGNMYIDSFSLAGQAIPGIPPAENPVPVPTPTEPEPFAVPEGVTLYEDVLIGKAGDRDLYTSIAVPSTPPSKPMPVMIYIHGGGWNKGGRKNALGSICNYVLKRGYIGVSLSYRLTPEAPYPAQIQDVKLAIRYLRAHAARYHIDPSRIGVWGTSAGGHLASLLGTTGDLTMEDTVTLDTGDTVNLPDIEGIGGWPEYSTKVQAVVDWYGPADFTTDFADRYSSVTKLLGGHNAKSVPVQARLAMPGTYASTDDPPFWIRHGDADAVIPYTDSVTFADQLTAAGVPVVDFQIVPGQGHGFTGEAKSIAETQAWAFMEQHVKNLEVKTPILYKDKYKPTDPTGIPVEIGSLESSDDALIDSTKPDTNMNSASGSSTGLFNVSSGTSSKKYVYFKFDASSLSDPSYQYEFQVSAKKGSSNTPVTLSVYGIQDYAWTESSLTWNNAPVKSLAEAEFLGSFTVEANNGGRPDLYSVDVTDYVRRNLSREKSTFILGDAGSAGISVNVYSKEANGTSNPRPKLIVKQIVDSNEDRTPPSWPEGSRLSLTGIDEDHVRLAWPKAEDNQKVAKYRLYQNDALVADISDGSTGYEAKSLAPKTQYRYKVEAVDAAGNISAAPLALTVSTLSGPLTPLPVKSVSASGSDGNIEDYTLDNNLYTRWSSAGEGPWIQYDLGEPVDIGYAGIAFYKGNARSATIDIETSDDGLAWTPRFNGTSSGKTTAMQAFDIPDVKARYLRIIGRGNSDGSLYTSLTEVHVYPPFEGGETPVAVIPDFVPKPPDGTEPFTEPGLKNADGSDHLVHQPHGVNGRTLNVVDYGADPADNDTDDRKAIQRAIDEAEPGDEVYFPNGVYNLNSAPDGLTNLTLKSEVNLRGESRGGSILKTSLNKVRNSSMIKSAKQHDLVISNLTLTSAWEGKYSTDHKVNNPDGGGPDMMITTANYGEAPSYNITIDGVIIEKFSRMGIRIENSHDIVVRNTTFRNATDVGPGGAGYGVSIQGIPKVDRNGFANDTRWNLVENSSFEGPYLRHGTLIQFVAHNNVIRNNQFRNVRLDAIDLHGELEYLNEIHGNRIEDMPYGAGIGLGNTGGTAPSNHSKSGPKNYIHDNTIRNTREGITVSMGTPDTIIEHNLIENTSDIPDAAGINILNGPGTVIRNNTIQNNLAERYWGILLEYDQGDEKAGGIGAGEPRDVHILNNIITGNSNGIHLESGKEIKLDGNVLDNQGVNFKASPDVTYSGIITSIQYSLTGPTNQDVYATLVSDSKFTVTNNGGSPTRRFTENGNFTFEYVDEAGHKGSMTAVVNTIDKTAPVLKVKLTPSVLKAPNRKLVDIRAVFDAADEGSGVASIRLISIAIQEKNKPGHRSNSPEEHQGDDNEMDQGKGKAGPDIQDAEFGTPDDHFRLRAEKSKRGKGRIYTVTYVITDHAGNLSETVSTVTVP
ncbi:alpha/beta hydrolase fold domain-containing protein [Paenibacillus sp. DMB20]|uniref:alpha/beta hydrolase fold domain-containing protein n=1 Tax=Paenibacillus sp. DMB20 TaxID=1642570 RepID=UPI000B2CA24B|nr:alpha/beta hydrolase fold domain-containing protein [Paenibacillus sp. DMB20]